MRVLPVNLNTILVELDDLAQTLALLASLQSDPITGIKEIVPAARTLMISRTPAITDWSALLQELSERCLDGVSQQSGRCVEIPVTYNGEDLEYVANTAGISIEEVIRRHTGSDHVVAFTGFAPGFAYLSGVDPILNMPRRLMPRPSLPAGSVALASGFSAVYPQTSPGGWQIIGSTNMPMWDLDRDPPSLLQPGDHVRFTAVNEQTSVIEQAPAKSALPQTGPLQIRNSGLLSTFQDLGRFGQAKQGVSVSGAMDKASLAAANRMVGNAETETCIETAYGRLELVCHSSTEVSVAGAQCFIDITDSQNHVRQISAPASVTLNPGDCLKLSEPVAGVFSYLAVRGGFDVPHVLGSASTDFMAKIGRMLSTGDYLPVKTDVLTKPTRFTATPISLPRKKEITTLDVVMGPRTDWFSQESLDLFASQLWTVTAQSNRVGLRLSGDTPLVRSVEMEGKELASEGTVRGAIQVPAAGQPILFMADHPLTGGYPVIACVADYHLDFAGQLPIGAQIRFRPIRAFEALELENPHG